MLDNIINHNVVFLQKHGVKMETNDDKDVYRYGMQVLYSYVINVTVLLLIALCYGRVYETAIMIVTFAVLQVFGGGYHAKTKTRCLLTMIAGSIAGNLLLNVNIITENILPLTVFISVIIFLLVPVQNENHPVTKKVYLRSKRISRIIVAGIAVISIIFMYTGRNIEASAVGMTLYLYFASIISANNISRFRK